MARLLVTGRDGGVREIEARGDLTVMEAMRDAGVDGLLALCGGCLSCATCHVYVDEGHLGLLSPPGVAERRMLAGSDHRRPTSRLSCQIDADEAGAVLAVTIAPEG